jgi:hypothetical protein
VKTTFEKAEQAARGISRKLGNPDWFLGVGIDADPKEGFVLSVRVAPGFSDRVSEFAGRFNGVVVRVLERGMARPRSAL